MGEEKMYTVYDGADSKYYLVNDFDEYLDFSSDDIHSIVYIATKFQSKFLTAMESLKEQGRIERTIMDDGVKVDIDPVDDLMMDVDLHDLIKNLNNSIEIYDGYFDEEKIEQLTIKMDETWENFTRDNKEFLNF